MSDVLLFFCVRVRVCARFVFGVLIAECVSVFVLGYACVCSFCVCVMGVCPCVYIIYAVVYVSICVRVLVCIYGSISVALRPRTYPFLGPCTRPRARTRAFLRSVRASPCVSPRSNAL